MDNFADLMTQLEALAIEPLEDDLGRLRPTEYALMTARSVLGEIAAVTRLSYGCISPDYEGGLDIHWFRPDRCVTLAIPHTSDRPKYFFHDEGPEHGLEYDVAATTIAPYLSRISD